MVIVCGVGRPAQNTVSCFGKWIDVRFQVQHWGGTEWRLFSELHTEPTGKTVISGLRKAMSCPEYPKMDAIHLRYLLP